MGQYSLIPLPFTEKQSGSYFSKNQTGRTISRDPLPWLLISVQEGVDGRGRYTVLEIIFSCSDLLSGKGPQQGVAVNLEAPAYFIHHANLH